MKQVLKKDQQIYIIVYLKKKSTFLMACLFVTCTYYNGGWGGGVGG